MQSDLFELARSCDNGATGGVAAYTLRDEEFMPPWPEPAGSIGDLAASVMAGRDPAPAVIFNAQM